jgi:hypothetical protein
MSEVQRVNFNVSNYKQWKEKKIVTMQRVGKSVILVKEMWNAETGESAEPQYVPMTTDTVQKAIDEIQTNINKMLNDIEMLKELKVDIEKISKEN